MKSPSKHDKPSRRTLGVRQIDLASVQTASTEIVRDINRDIILELVRFKQPLARADLSRLSGLRRSTVSAIVEQLIQESWVIEGAVVKPARGRPSTSTSRSVTPRPTRTAGSTASSPTAR